MENATPDEADDAMDPVVVPIDGVLDLHTFAPKDLDGLLQDISMPAAKSGIYELRIIHGKGSGVLRSRVRSLLKKNSGSLLSKMPLQRPEDGVQPW
jgi:DNA-nicking Smr family endonuclease